ncbi:hypothetical protein [Sorangium sp. So ce117]|uniref:hypothetical protein n=1 Tax=Sorangium sp. So ce117 TaxID=3133277 RepID=UPI003F5E50D0
MDKETATLIAAAIAAGVTDLLVFAHSKSVDTALKPLAHRFYSLDTRIAKIGNELRLSPPHGLPELSKCQPDCRALFDDLQEQLGNAMDSTFAARDNIM